MGLGSAQLSLLPVLAQHLHVVGALLIIHREAAHKLAHRGKGALEKSYSASCTLGLAGSEQYASESSLSARSLMNAAAMRTRLPPARVTTMVPPVAM